MTSYQLAELWGKIEWEMGSAFDAAKKQGHKELDKHLEKVSELRANLPVNDARTVGVVVLQDTLEKTDKTKIQISIEKDNLAVLIHPDGTGTYDGPYAPILLEQHEGTLLLVVWSDITDQEPTHVIDLSTAMEKPDTD